MKTFKEFPLPKSFFTGEGRATARPHALAVFVRSTSFLNMHTSMRPTRHIIAHFGDKFLHCTHYDDHIRNKV